MKQYIVGSIVLVLCALMGSNSSLGEQVSVPRGELRIVDKSHYNWLSITFNVMEHLVDLDKDGTLIPRLAMSWRWLDDRTIEFALRQGVTFHNGEVFDAEIVKLNWEEYFQLEQPIGLGKMMSFNPGSSLQIIDPYTVRLVLPVPDGGVLAKLSYLHLANRQFYREVGWGEKHW